MLIRGELLRGVAFWLLCDFVSAASLNFGGISIEVKTPQLIGIILGCIVFTTTITVVIYLLFKSGTIAGFLEEMRTGKSPKPSSQAPPPQIDTRPELYDYLLEAARTLPLQPSPPCLEGKTVTVRQFDTSKDAAVLFQSSNGSPQYHESAYDPIARIWGWIDLDDDARVAAAAVATPSSQSHESPATSIESHAPKPQKRLWPCDSLESFSKYFGRPLPAGKHLVLVDAILKRQIGMMSLLDNSPKNLSVRIGETPNHSLRSRFSMSLPRTIHFRVATAPKMGGSKLTMYPF